VTVGRARIDRCAQCRGHWFDGDEVEHALNVTTQGMSHADAASLRPTLPAWTRPVEDVRYLACVRCGERMARRQVAQRAGVIVDICRPHGVWFDADEFEHFTDFVKAGGLEVLRHDGIVAAERDRKLAAQPPVPVPPTWVDRRSCGPSMTGDLVIDGLRALFRILR
jgi:Zn-finger nucleic acid-binding protein